MEDAGHDALVRFVLADPEKTLVRARIAAPDLPRVGDRVTLGICQNALAYPLAYPLAKARAAHIPE